MGRHAAPGDDEPELEDAVTDRLMPPVQARPTPRGRHAVAEDDDTVAVAAASPVADPVAAAAEAERPADRPERKERPTAADLRLLRSDPALRNRVIAAVLAPFVLFVLVLAVVGQLGTWEVWIWLPLIAAGLGGGLLLDAAHAKLRPAEPAEPSGR